MAAEDERIVVKPDGHGSSVPMDVPGGFGKWFLHFPENMLLDGPGRGKAKMTKSVGDDGTIVVEGKMDGEFAHAIRITYKPGTETIDLGHGKGEREVFVVEQTYPDVPNDRPVYYIEDDGTRVVQHRRERYETPVSPSVTTDYVPGLLMFDRSRARQGDEWTEAYTRYVDQMDDSPVEEVPVEESLRITDVGQALTVPAGEFECLVLKRSILRGQTPPFVRRTRERFRAWRRT